MTKITIGEFISEKIINAEGAGPLSYVTLYRINDVDYIAKTKDGKEHKVEQISSRNFKMTIGEDIYILRPEDGDSPDI